MKKILLTSIAGALFATSAFAQSSNFNVINSIIYDGSYDFSDKKMDSYYQKVANSNNLGGNISLGYVDLNTLDSSYDKKTYAFFAVNGKSKAVSIANILVVDKDNTQNTPNVNIYAINKNEIAVCAKPKQSVYWFGQAGMGYETFLDNQKSKDGECLTFYMDENYWNNNPIDFEQSQLKSAKIALDVNKIYTNVASTKLKK